uniref:Uncharacterized protein n=1 Tax=Oryza brachyantha TaxID=4533 RepID=J3MDT7_ORYBR
MSWPLQSVKLINHFDILLLLPNLDSYCFPIIQFSAAKLTLNRYRWSTVFLYGCAAHVRTF